MTALILFFARPLAKSQWEEGKHPRGGHGEFARNPAVPQTSAGIQTLEEAEAYWAARFADGKPHKIKCKYNKKKYQFYVIFVRNHAYTEDKAKTGKDKMRVFDIKRAKGMDFIWHVLRFPNAVTLSRQNNGNRLFDKEISFADKLYGRVVLQLLDKKDGAMHFQFVSWHPVDKIQHNMALQDSKRKNLLA